MIRQSVMQAISIAPRWITVELGLLATFGAGAAMAALPASTPAQLQAANLKKQQAAEQGAREKQEIAASMDRVAARWRARATAAGWDVHPPTPVAPASGIAESAAQAGASAQPAGQLGATAASVPVRSEKLGTAPPSADVKDPAKKGK